MERRLAIVRSLSQRPPWGGIDSETLTELYVEAVATVARIAASQCRRDWRTHRDLERAVIAAYRFQAQHYWRAVNAQKRRGDRDAISFDPELHAETEEVLARIFDASPHEELIARDWLAQLQGDVRSFWQLLLEGVPFKEAGDRLGVSNRECKVLHRAGLEQLGRFRALQEAGKVCQLRAPAIAAYRAGTADEVTAERARAHLECCLPCALVHDARASALRRGILHVLPLPAVGRVVSRLRDLLSDRAAEATAGGATGIGGAFLLGNGATTALLCAGALAGGACVVGIGPIPNPLAEHHAHHPAEHRAIAAASEPVTTASTSLAPSPLSNTLAASGLPTPRSSTTHAKAPRASASEFGAPSGAAKPKSTHQAAPTPAQTREFDAVSQAGTAPSSSPAVTASTASTRSASTRASSSPSPTSSSATSPSTTSPEFGGP